MKIHLGLLLAELICIPAFVIETTRALGGNTLSWAYVFEWPILGTYAVYMWRKLLQDGRGDRAETQPTNPDESKNDPKLQAWNDYLAEVHGADRSTKSGD